MYVGEWDIEVRSVCAVGSDLCESNFCHLLFTSGIGKLEFLCLM